MHTAQYTTTANGAGEVGQYPLSTETLEFIQQQVLLLERLSSLVGVDRPWIIKSPGREEKDEGLLAYNGALYPIESPGTSLVPPNRYRLLLKEEYKDIITADNRYEYARKYMTAYLAPDDGTQTSDQELGMVLAISSSEVMTSDSPSLNSLQEMITTIPVEGSYLLFGHDVPKHSKAFLSEKSMDNSPVRSVPMSNREIDGACLTTHLFKGCNKSYMQELETSDGVKYKRVCISPDEAEKLQDVTAYSWHCLPNQVIGSALIKVVANHQTFHADIEYMTGVLREAKCNDATRGKIEITPERHVLLRTGAARMQATEHNAGDKTSFILGYSMTQLDDPAVITIKVPEVMQTTPTRYIFLSLISR